MYTRVIDMALGATPVDTGSPQPGAPQPPIYPLIVGAHGGYREVRSSPSDGSCGVHAYPCQHPGVDVQGMAGTQVVAPESGQVVMTGDGNSAPFVGYGPWFVVIAGRDSGKYHLLAHMDPLTSSMATQGQVVESGDVVGMTSSANHTHWEVRDKIVPDFAAGETNLDNNTDPVIWLRGGWSLGTLLIAGSAGLLLWLLYRRRV